LKPRAITVVLVSLVLVLIAGCNEPVDQAEQEALRLAEEYRSELDGVELTIDKLEIVTGEGSQRERSLVIAYKTEADSDRELFNEEILVLLEPAVDEKYGLADIMILATDGEGVLSKGVSIEGTDLRQWGNDEITVEEFVQRWMVTGF